MIQAGISTPAAGAGVNKTFTVTGFVFDDGSTGSFPGDIRFTIGTMFVQFGNIFPAVNVTRDGDNWSATLDLPAGTTPGQALTVKLTCGILATSQDNPGENSSIVVTDTRQVVAEQTRPQVTITAFPGVQTVDQLPFRLPVLSGQALDDSGVTLVQYQIDDAPRQNVDALTGDTHQRNWSKANLDFDIGQHTVTVFATDVIGNEGSASAALTVLVTDPDGTPPPGPIDLTFTPTFEHQNWINNFSRIVADGPDGFNVRFDAIQADLRQAGTVVGAINTALDQTTAITGQQRLTPGVALISLAAPGTGGWTYDATGAAHPDAGSGGGTAVMDLSFPEGIRLVSFRAMGLLSAVRDISLTVYRSALADASQFDLLAQITGASPGMTNPYDLTVPVNSAFAVVDPGRFRYFLIAHAGNVADPAATSLATVQFAHRAA
jgi:hypothetical protein